MRVRPRQSSRFDIHLAPVLRGSGTKLFDHFDGKPVELERISVTEAPGVTHFRFRVRE